MSRYSIISLSSVYIRMNFRGNNIQTASLIVYYTAASLHLYLYLFAPDWSKQLLHVRIRQSSFPSCLFSAVQSRARRWSLHEFDAPMQLQLRWSGRQRLRRFSLLCDHILPPAPLQGFMAWFHFPLCTNEDFLLSSGSILRSRLPTEFYMKRKMCKETEHRSLSFICWASLSPNSLKVYRWMMNGSMTWN